MIPNNISPDTTGKRRRLKHEIHGRILDDKAGV